MLISEPRPLRLADVGAHPQSYGFPLAHPPMTTFLGVPIVIEGQAWGNLYLTEKDGGEFTDDDEEAAVVLADWAAIAISNSRLYRAVRERRDELERTIRGLETTTEISRALGGVTDLDRVLELVVKRSRALLDARAAEIALVEGDEFVIAAVAGEGVEGLEGTRISIEESLAGAALKSGRLQRFPEIPRDTFAYREMGARSALVTPMSFRNRPVGFLIVFDRLRGDRPFNEEDERLLEAFAASAAIAVATAQHAGDEALRRSLEASEQERSRWARELHDETLQQFAGLRVLLSAARRSGDRAGSTPRSSEAIEHITTGIGDLRSLITDLRPAALDEFGIRPALETLVTRVSRQSDLAVDLEIDLAYEGTEAALRHPAEIESTVYRVVQEALTNVAKHAEAARVRGPRQRSSRRRRGSGPRRRQGLRSRGAHRRASACSACASGWRWWAGRSMSSPRRARGRRCARLDPAPARRGLISGDGRGLGGEERAERLLRAARNDDHGALDRAHQPAADAADEHRAQRAVAARSREHQVEPGAVLAELVGRVARESHALARDVVRQPGDHGVEAGLDERSTSSRSVTELSPPIMAVAL